MHRANNDFTGNRRLIIAMLVAAVLWLTLLRAAHIHQTDTKPNGDRAELCDICAQLSAPAGILPVQLVLSWISAWSVIALLVSLAFDKTVRYHFYLARGPPRH